jgi:replicative DNA helicase
MAPETATATAQQRTLPHNLEAERSVLGAILIDNDTFNVAAAIIDGRAFFRDAHRRIYERMMDLSERSQPIDLVTLKEELERSGELEEVGGPAYVASLVDGVPRSTNVEYYAQIVKEKATLRNLIFSANRILGSAYEADQEADLILDEAESTLVRESFPKIERLFEHKTFITGV